RGPVEGAFQTSEFARDFLAFCSEQSRAVRSRDDFTYLVEIQSAQIISNHDDFVEDRLDWDFFQLKRTFRSLHYEHPAFKSGFNGRNNFFYSSNCLRF